MTVLPILVTYKYKFQSPPLFTLSDKNDNKIVWNNIEWTKWYGTITEWAETKLSTHCTRVSIFNNIHVLRHKEWVGTENRYLGNEFFK